MGDIGPVIITAIIAAIPGTIIAVIALRKSPSEIGKTDAERNKLYADIADHWAEHVEELQKTVDLQSDEIKGLRLDITQVRRENEKYRRELIERDEIIRALKEWASALVAQLREHAPNVNPIDFKGNA